jgi:hypothetical protein
MQLVLAVVFSVAVTAIAVVLSVALPVLPAWSKFDTHQRKSVVVRLSRLALVFAGVSLAYTLLFASLTLRPVPTVALSLGVTAALVLWLISMKKPLGRIEHFGKQLLDPARRHHAKQALLDIASALAPDDLNRLVVATTLGNGGCVAEANAVLRTLKEEQLLDDEDMKGRYLLMMALFFVHANALADARSLLARIPPLGEGSHLNVVRRFTEARLLVKEGRPDAALALLTTPESRPDLECLRRIVLAHVCAARHDESGLQAEFQWLEERHGKTILYKVVEPDGPASARALARLNESKSSLPFR